MKLCVILSNIRDIKSGKKKLDTGAGICENTGIQTISSKILKSWDKYAMDYMYPVPSTDAGITSEEKYIKEGRANNLWNKDTEYGKLRYELLDFLEEYLKDCSEYVVSSRGAYNCKYYERGLQNDEYLVFVKNSLVPENENVENCLRKVIAEGKNLLDIPYVVRRIIL
jgi:uncharacterized protein YodC (DUF2158 family)